MLKKFNLGRSTVKYIMLSIPILKAKDVLKAAELVGVTKADTLYVLK